jgi:hypothetical protein
MELKKYFGQSGKVYYVTFSSETWHAFVETNEGFIKTEAKSAAIDCGAIGDRSVVDAHGFWKQIWIKASIAA